MAPPTRSLERSSGRLLKAANTQGSGEYEFRGKTKAVESKLSGDAFFKSRLGDVLYFFLIDVQGHGVDSCEQAVAVKPVLQQELSTSYRRAQPGTPIEAIITRTIYSSNHQLDAETGNGLFCTVVAAGYDTQNNKITVLNGSGVEGVIWDRSRKRATTVIEPTRTLALGMVDQQRYQEHQAKLGGFKFQTYTLSPQQQAYFFSDGLQDLYNTQARTHLGKEGWRAHAQQVLEHAYRRSTTSLSETVNRLLDLPLGYRADDDRTVVAFRAL